MLNEGRTPKHSDLFSDRAPRVIAVGFGGRLDDIDGKPSDEPGKDEMCEKFVRLLSKARLSDLGPRGLNMPSTFSDAGRSPGTCNHYRAGIRAFVRWCNGPAVCEIPRSRDSRIQRQGRPPT